MARRKSKFDISVDDLNLVPIMNMVMCLIPVVLVGSSQVTVGVVNVNSPKFGGAPSTASNEDEDKPLNLTVAIGEDGFRITASGADINEILGITPSEENSTQGPLIAKDGELYNYADLYTKLMAVKKQHPDETIMNLTAGSGIAFKHVINVMDVARVQLSAESYSDSESLMTADIRYDSENKPELLWPDVVFAVAQ
ncbi:biopolymer transporter ExbD [Myxococcota bacterium]|nr:biopolymer transporter ExbD [Myxococcota bacterium]